MYVCELTVCNLGLSDILCASLPNGWRVGVTYQHVLTPSGDCLETKARIHPASSSSDTTVRLLCRCPVSWLLYCGALSLECLASSQGIAPDVVLKPSTSAGGRDSVLDATLGVLRSRHEARFRVRVLRRCVTALGAGALLYTAARRHWGRL